MKILVVEDDQLVADALVELLTGQTHTVEVAIDGEAGAYLLSTYEYDLVILDLTLPKIDGITLCKQIRAQGSQSPILILTGRADRHTKAIGLDAGADDYVVKPFEPEELLARVRALLRRAGETPQALLTWGDLSLDPSSCQVTYGDRLIALTPKEYALTELFLRNPKRVFSCSTILDHLWSYEEAPGEEAVRTHIKGLRQKLKAADPRNDMVETVYGIGYRLKMKEANPGVNHSTVSYGERYRANNPNSVANRSDDLEAEMLAKIRQIWLTSQDRVNAQLAAIKQLITGLTEASDLNLDSSNLPPLCDLLANAIKESHSLAGSLGTFGLTQGSTFARQIETILKTETKLGPELEMLQTCFTALQQEIEVSLQVGPQPSDLRSSKQSEAEPLSIKAVLPQNDQSDQEVDRPILLVIDPDTQLTQTLLRDPALHQFQIEVAKKISRAKEKINHQCPQVILFDPDVAKNLDYSFAFLHQLNQHSPPIPTVIFTVHTELLERRNLLRSGGSLFLPKPATPSQILDAIEQVIERSDQLQSGVLIVDDDPTILTLIQHLLQPWGLKVTTLADPKQFWQVLEATQPNLLILDILMPDVNGIELCQVVRGDARWSDLPIVVLTAHNDADTINQVFSVGADDFVTKPIVGPELVTRVINRLERMKLIQRRYHHSNPLAPRAMRYADSAIPSETALAP